MSFNKHCCLWMLPVFLMGLVSCKGGIEDADNADVIYPSVNINNKIHDKTALSELFPSHRVIKLQTDSESLIGGRRTKIIKKDSLFLVQSMNEIIIFNDNGDYLKKLSRSGGGPEEYNDLLDFDLGGDKRDEIWVSSNTGIFRYALSDFTFLGKLSFGFYINAFKCLRDGLFIATTTDEETYKVIDDEGAVKASYMKKDLANSLKGIVDFVYSPDKKMVLHSLQWSNDAVYYDLESSEFGICQLIKGYPDLLTAEINRKIYDSEGYFEQLSYVDEHYDQIPAFRSVNNQVVMLMRAPENKCNLVLVKDGKCVVIPYLPTEDSMIENNMVDNASQLMLNTLVCGESDNSFLFFVDIEDSEENPYILEVFDINVPKN